jgi:galactan endo-1,6-beta-galactosidase
VEPYNEPSAGWWQADGTQEGCHVSAGIQQQVLGYLRTELDARGLPGVAVAASDENSYDAATATWTGFAAATRAKVGRVNVHGYQTGDSGAARRGLYAAVRGAGKKLWQTEYGEGFAHGLYLAYNLSADLRHLHPTAWCYWQPVDASTWGLVKATYTDPTTATGTLGDVANKYFVLAQYTRHIRPGMRILDSGDQATVAGYDPAARRLVLVTVRGDSPQQVTYDLSRFTAVGTTARHWTTDAHPDGTVGQQYARAPAPTIANKRLSAALPAYSLHTFELDNVTP